MRQYFTNPKNQIIGIASLAGLIILGLIIYKVNRNKRKKKCESTRGKMWVKGECVKKPPPPPDPDASKPPVSEGGTFEGGTGIQWTPNALALEIFNNIEGANWYCYYDTVNRILELTDDQLRVLYAYYNQVHAQEYPTITQLFNAEWDNHCYEDPGYTKVTKRFMALGLT